MSSSPEPVETQPKNESVEQLTEDVNELYLESFSFTTAAAIIGYVDRKICATLIDGRRLFGVLRSFDQYGTVVIQDTIERIYLSNDRFGEDYLGILLIRGENILLLGDVDIDKEDAPLARLQQIPYQEAKKERKLEKDLWIKQNKLNNQKLHKLGLVSESYYGF